MTVQASLLELQDTQRNLELRSIDEGVERYRRQRRALPPSHAGPEKNLLIGAIESTSNMILAKQKLAFTGRASRGVVSWGPALLSLDADVLALVGLVTMYNGCSRGQNTLNGLAISVADAVKVELHYKMIKSNPDLYKMLNRRYGSGLSPSTVDAYRRIARIKPIKWTAKNRVWIGSMILQCVLDGSDMFKVHLFPLKFNPMHHERRIILQEAYIKAIENDHGSIELLKPSHLPMIIPPCDWTDTERGGYLIHDLPFIKGDDVVPKERTHDLTKVYAAVNTLQSTGFRVNAKLLHVQMACWQRGIEVGKLPPRDAFPLPPRLSREHRADPETAKIHKIEVRRILKLNASMGSKRATFVQASRTALEMAQQKAIYFAWQLDWRGRGYTVSGALNPQGPDTQRSLLSFAKKKPFGPAGWREFKIHLANVMGYDKVPFAARLKKVDDEHDTILGWGSDPLGHTGWHDCDKPWATLAASFEYTEAYLSGTPEKYRSSIPVARDGTCNGLQHFSALGRDLVGGAATNLLPSAEPQDIYRRVASRCNALIDQDVGILSGDTEDPTRLYELGAYEPKDDGQHPAYVWQGRIFRRHTKRGVMTTPYGVTLQGIRNQFFDEGIMDEIEQNKAISATYLTNVLHQAVGEVVIAARAYMLWLQEVSTIAAKADIAIDWHVSDGMHVINEYRKGKTKRITCATQSVCIRDTSSAQPLSIGQMYNGIAPNFVHSLDAAHLRMTVNACKSLGVDSWLMVHDSYATHACDVPVMARVLREQFVSLHEPDILGEMKGRLETDRGLELPPLPERGDLRLQDVLESEYFFS